MAEYKINYTQSNFTGGIIAAELYGRNDFNKVKTGLKKCANWTIREAGGLEFRRGTKYLQTIPVAAGNNFKMASLDKQLLFFCSDGIRYIQEEDGSWDTRQIANLGSNNWMCVAYGNSKFVAVDFDGRLSTSTDGINWTSATYIAPLARGSWTGITYGNSKFVIINGAGSVSTSANGTYWEDPTQVANLGDKSWSSVCWDGTKFVALSATGYISTSTDGTTWDVATQVANLGNKTWKAIVYDGSKFVALSNRGYISTSTDGITWVDAEFNANLGDNSWTCMSYCESEFVALSALGYVSKSTNGTVWTVATQDPDLESRGWVSVAWDGKKFVALEHDDGYVSTMVPNGWKTLSYPVGVTPDMDKLQFTELKRRLYYYDGAMKMCEVVLNAGVPSTNISTFETAPTGCSISSSKTGTSPTVHVDVVHRYTFSLATNEEEETIRFAGTTAQTANVELTQANSDSDGKGQQVDVTVTLTANQASQYNKGKIYIYKLYQGYYYFLTALDVASGTTSYTYNDKGQFSPDVSKVAKTNPGYINADGSISAVNSIADYNQRLFLTRTNQNVTQIIFSAVGNTSSFAYSPQRADTDAGNLELPISNYDSWCKVVSGLDLILSTSYTISKVSGSGDLQTDTVLWDGLSKTVDPVRTRRSLIYTNASNRNIYDLTYNEYGQYDSIDLTLLIKYIFEEKTIKRLAFKDYPVKTIYVLCSDGELYCLTYIKDQNIYAWYKIEHEGLVKDVCVVNTDTEDEVFVVINYNGTYVVEQAYRRTENVYLDCTVVKDLSEIVNNKISGLGMFEGKKVRVFDTGNNLYYGDYDVMNPKTVVEGGKTVEIDDLDFDGYLVENGEIQLPEDIELVGPVLVGLPYYAVAETIPLEFQDQNGNSTIGRKKAVNEAYLRYGDSRGITYKTMGHEYNCGVCERDIADNAQFLERGQIKLHTVSEYKWDSTIKILQRQPYPARIESITLGLTFNDKS